MNDLHAPESTLEIVSAVGLVTVQDLGRTGLLSRGVPPGGAIVPELLVRANLAAGNPPDAAAIEIIGRLIVRSTTAIVVATDTGETRALEAHQRHTFAPSMSQRACYLAVRGGLDVPLVLGSRSTLFSTQIGGHEGRVLKHRDRLPILPRTAHSSACDSSAPARIRDLDRAWWLDDPREEMVPFDVIAGPDLDRFPPGALDTFLATEFTISPRSDRVGIWLDGASIPAASDTRASMPMIRGAIEIPAGGAPIVLGPEHPTTGGYPLLAVVVSTELGRLYSRKPGTRVRFASVTAEDARRRQREY